ncbi:MAG TPA: hypothetical protein VHE30_17480 [Polyangiaceae bacterium]|nr:hypothetical protein [Polyangiaceae bacterium]
MNLSNLLLTSLGISSLAFATACSSSKTDDNTQNSSGGVCPDIDYASYASMAQVSFKDDIMPIFGGSCTASDCHKSPEKKADLYLGVRCATDTATKACTFPAQEDPNATSSNPPMPLTQKVIDDVYASLMAPSTTTPTHQRVVAGDPEHSFIIQKCAGVESEQGYTDCKNQDPSHTANPVPCGDSMPLNSPALCEGSSRARFDKLAAWIAQGAQKN